MSKNRSRSLSAKAPKGPLWNEYRYTLGRKIKRDEKCGVVLGELDGKLKVLWLDDSMEFDIEEEPIAELEEFLLDEFEDEFAFKTVVEAQERGWSKEMTPRKKRKSRPDESGEDEEDAPEGEESMEKEDDKSEGVKVDGEVPSAGETPIEVLTTQDGDQSPLDDVKTPKGLTNKIPILNIPAAGVQGLTKAVYPKDVCFSSGDRPLESWSTDQTIIDDEEMDFIVEKIVDERVVRGEKEYLVKWEGFQLNPGTRKRGVVDILKKGDWLPAENLEDAYALDVWEKKKPQYFLDAQAAAASGSKKAAPTRAKKKQRSSKT
ncbi:hypothetical protein BSKO_08807 [Bryopsis sp. KO-2023]|nr:hypothetical protein BSKO_08807 [Bryopsis sp. KO-2023]